MKDFRKLLRTAVALSLILVLAAMPVFASTFTDAHGNVVDLDEALKALASEAGSSFIGSCAEIM